MFAIHPQHCDLALYHSNSNYYCDCGIESINLWIIIRIVSQCCNLWKHLLFLFFYSDSVSLSSSTSEDIRPRMNSYQQTGMFKKKKKKEELVFNGDSSNESMDTYNPSFENPLYGSNPALDSKNPSAAIDCIDNPVYEDVKDVKLDQYEVPKLKNENPYEF